MEPKQATGDADDVKRQIRRRLFAPDFERGEAANSRFAAHFIICPVCRGNGKEQQWVRYDDQDVCERYECSRCDGAGFIERISKGKVEE